MMPPSVALFRTKYRVEHTSKFYSGAFHLLFTSSVSLAAITFALLKVHQPAWNELLTIPITFFVANYFEYLMHKNVMHAPIRFLRILYRHHTLEHHQFFTHEAMAWDNCNDFKAILFHAETILLFIALQTLPISLLLYAAVSANTAFLFAAVSIGYFLIYEWLHFSYHAPENSLIGRLPVVQRLRKLHAQHHHLVLMNQYNFNVTFPICDLIFGTYYKGTVRHADESMSRIAS